MAYLEAVFDGGCQTYYVPDDEIEDVNDVVENVARQRSRGSDLCCLYFNDTSHYIDLRRLDSLHIRKDTE